MPLTQKTLNSICALALISFTGGCGDDGGGDDGAGDTGGADTTAGPSTTTTGPSTTTTTGPSTTTTTTGPDDTGTDTGDTGPDPDTGDSGTTGPGAVCETDICETYGAAVPAVSSQIVDEAAVDPQFAEFFAPLVAQGPDAVQAFKDSLTAFISDAYGCSEGLYTGPSMEDAHEGLNITQEEYDAFIGLIAGVLSGAGVPDDDINLCFAPPLVDPAFSGTIVGQ